MALLYLPKEDLLGVDHWEEDSMVSRSGMNERERLSGRAAIVMIVDDVDG
jgi:hypothetical protein